MSDSPPTRGDADNAPPHRPADDQEQVYFDGPPLARAQFGTVLIWGLIGLLVIAGAIVGAVLLQGPWPVYAAAAVLVLVGIAMILAPAFLIRATRYRITNYRIDYERGILSKRIDTLELWHVEDISFQQSLLERMMGVGSINVVSHDETTPQLTMRGLPNARAIFEALKQRVIAVKRQRGVIKMDLG